MREHEDAIVGLVYLAVSVFAVCAVHLWVPR